MDRRALRGPFPGPDPPELRALPPDGGSPVDLARVAPRFVIGELWHRAPELFPDDVDGLDRAASQGGRHPPQEVVQPDIFAVPPGSMTPILHVLNRHSRGALLRAGGQP